ncbi:MAG: XRE family transcriptional regulator [Streptococcaceae bacterium]|nr:XRE family transcriptional regulator [Streptococcaceae bacterium]
MPETNHGREKILAYMEENGIQQLDLATLYGLKQEDLSKYLSGQNQSPKAIQVLTKIIGDFKIR